MCYNGFVSRGGERSHRFASAIPAPLSSQTLPLFSTASKHPTHRNSRKPIPFKGLLHSSLFSYFFAGTSPNSLPSFNTAGAGLSSPFLRPAHPTEADHFHWRPIEENDERQDN